MIICHVADFQNIDVNRKEYRAWYGLGQAYELLNMHQYALHYYQRATALRSIDFSFSHCRADLQHSQTIWRPNLASSRNVLWRNGTIQGGNWLPQTRVARCRPVRNSDQAETRKIVWRDQRYTSGCLASPTHRGNLYGRKWVNHWIWIRESFKWLAPLRHQIGLYMHTPKVWCTLQTAKLTRSTATSC